MTMTRDRKTGKMRKVDPAKSLSAKKAARARGHKPLTTATKIKIAKSVKRAQATGRTALGRKVIKHASSTSSVRPAVRRGL